MTTNTPPRATLAPVVFILAFLLFLPHGLGSLAENGSAKVCHGTGGIVLLRAEQNLATEENDGLSRAAGISANGPYQAAQAGCIHGLHRPMAATCPRCGGGLRNAEVKQL